MALANRNVPNRANGLKSSAVRRASRGVIESLETRTLLAATLSLTNPENLPSSDRLIFNYIQNPDPSVPNGVHDQQSLEISDTGADPLVISSMTLSGPWAFVGAPAGGYSNITVLPGTPLTVTLSFTQRSLPPHTSNQTNYTSESNGGATITGSLSIISNDATTPTKTVTLAGYWQNQSADEEEPSLQTIANNLAGYGTVIATASQLQTDSNGIDLQNNGTKPTYYGQEVVSTAWDAADPTQPVTIQELASYYVEGVSDTTYWYSTASLNSHPLMTSATNQNQTLLPTMANGQLMTASFTPGGPFGLRDDNLYSGDSVNVANGDTGDDGHRFRFYPLVDENGNAVPNTWLVAVHEGQFLADYQDAVYIVSNMEPAPAAGTPPAPTGLTATTAADPALTWNAVTYSDLAGYNVYRSTSLTGTFTKLTPTPITATTFTDSASPPVDVKLYYRVTAVDAVSGNESAPDTTTTNTPGGPVAASFAVSAFSAEALPINILNQVTDTTGTPTASSLAITTAPTHGTATVDTTNGVITYTPAAGYAGSDTIVYSISDSNGNGPSTGTISISVTNPAATPPIASAQSGTTLANTPVVLTPIALDNTGAVITPMLVEIGNTSADFTAAPLPTTLTTATGATLTLNSNNTVTYTPVPNFVGVDSFLFKVEDSHGIFSSQATFTINVGVQIASTRGANKSVVYTDSGGALVTVTLSKGIADVYYNGAGTESALKGKITVTGTHLTIDNIAASQTTAASALTLATRHNAGAITLGGVTDPGTLGTITGLSSVLAGVAGTPTIVVGGVRAINLKSISSAEIQVSNVGVTADTLTAGAVVNSFFTSTVPVNSLKVASWTNSASNLTTEAVTAPVVKTLSVVGEFDPSLNLTGPGRDLNSATVRGAVNKGSWTIAGSAGSITLGSVAGQWGGLTVTGALTGVRILTGGLPADISAGTLNSLSVPGILSGNITTTGNLLSLTAGQLVGALVDVGSTAVDAASATVGNLGGATLRSLRLTGKTANTFSDSNVVANVIGAIITGPINLAGTDEGIAATSIRSATLTLATGTLHLSAATLLSNAALSTFLTEKGASLGTFTIDIL